MAVQRTREEHGNDSTKSPRADPAGPQARRFEGQVVFITGAARGQGRAEAAKHGVTGLAKTLANELAKYRSLMDQFIQFTGPTDPGCPQTRTLDYYDGNTVTALWNYAQHFSLSDNSFGTTFGPSHVGAVNLVSGNNHGAILSQPASAVVDGTQIGNVEPTYDDCPSDPVNIHFDNKNVGDLLNQRKVTWGWFSDGFKPTSRQADGTPVCNETRTSKSGVTDTVYDSGNSPFQYYTSTANQLHLPATSVAAMGNQDQANHEYDTTDFWAAARADNLPAVSFIKAGGYQQGGGSDSDPLDEQVFLVNTINRLERLPSWHSTAVVIMYDDSDGGYDHVMPPIVNDSQTPVDVLTGPGQRAPKLFLDPSNGEPARA